ncbi:hypothetical protein [Metamycoplasma auris]|uniref:Uncharacterized protein n=1 Tax=Metamycoplasma auris TaxID=51363 RepID=A0A2W7HX91_9BACT|nr:hypothetical protein [Metamycoplasma auris]PZV99815.1 hypothetical protein BCF89_10820 [Metamycoplasma auris]
MRKDVRLANKVKAEKRAHKLAKERARDLRRAARKAELETKE